MTTDELEHEYEEPDYNEAARPERPRGPRPPDSPLRHLHGTQVSVEKLRIALGNRAAAIKSGADDANRPVPKIYTDLTEGLLALEQQVDRAIAKELETWPVYTNWMVHVRGIGPGLSGQLLALLLPPTMEHGPSSWYKAAGLVPSERPDGTMRMPRDRKDTGPATHHRYLRRCLYNVATSLVRNGAYYRVVYEEGKEGLFIKHQWKAARFLADWRSVGVEARPEWLLERFGAEVLEKEKLDADAQRRPAYGPAVALIGNSDPTWPLGRVESATRWRMVRIFLAHLWEAWCEEMGITPRRPYIVERDPSHSYIPRPMPAGDGKLI